jgi:hypothetical protein
MYCEDSGTEGIRFPVYHFCLRGGFLFYFDVEDVEEESGRVTSYYGPPVGVVPLSKTTVEFPPGGRRVFREHAPTDARTGYELVILHVPDDGDIGEMRPPSFLVADSMNAREKWAVALRARAEIDKPTVLRSGGIGGGATSRRSKGNDGAGGDGKKSGLKKREGHSSENQTMDANDDAELANAVVDFGIAGFSEADWIQHFFLTNNDFDVPSMCRKLENWQVEMKKSLKGAVLEQYEYFVEASGEMTNMGKQVSSLTSWIETQVETIRTMKEIDFAGAVEDTFDDNGGKGDEDGGSEEPPRLDEPAVHEKPRVQEEMSIFSEDDSFLTSADKKKLAEAEEDDEDSDEESDEDEEEEDAPPIDVPDWIDDVAEDVAALVREGRYTEAVDLHVKARHEVADLMDKHERPTPYKLNKKQLETMNGLQQLLEKLGKRIGDRLEETLRRKNEAIRQALKRERADTNVPVSIVSPCALNDDSVYLHLLVKMGKTMIAAEAFSSRRSLLLVEAIQERPICGSGSVDLVIYAAQLSQSFFSCLASSVEGFLDLFLVSSSKSGGDSKNEDDASSMSGMSNPTNVPAGAVAAVVLWCDIELAKFAHAFGGTRILANLALSPPPRSNTPKMPRVVGESGGDEGSRERKAAIDVASQCIAQAFLYASQNLDSVGLPLTPRLAGYIRPRLKGCEDEVSMLLDDRWKNLTADWRQRNSMIDTTLVSMGAGLDALGYVLK